MPQIFKIEVSGNNYDMGFQIGRAVRPLLTRSIYGYRAALASAGWEGPWILPRDYLDAALNAFPPLVEELQGMAAGSGLDFGDLFFLNALEEALDIRPPSACTSIGLSGPGGAWLGHNEDWYAGDAETVIALKAKPAGGPAFISVTAAPFLAAVGVNEAGLAQGINSVPAADCRVGVPRMFAARAALEAETIADACRLAAPEGRAGGYNHLLVHGAGDLGNFETTSTNTDYLPAEKVVFHTNHYLSPRLKDLAGKPSAGSLARFRRLNELVENAGFEEQGGPKNLLRALTDHENRPLSICRHSEEQEDGEGTIFSVLIDPRAFRVFGVAGNPCRGGFEETIF